MLKNTTTVVISCLVALLAVEFLLRLLSPINLTGGSIGAYQYDGQLGVRLKPNIHWFKTTDYQQEVYTNKLGTVNFQQSFETYPVLILAIGDSYTQGTGLPADANYPFQLDLYLNSSVETGAYLHKYAVVNLGLAAFGGEQELLSLSIYKEMLGKPKYILYLGCDNDYDDDVRFKNGFSHRHLVDRSPHWGIFLKPLQWITQSTELGKRLNLARSTLKLKAYGIQPKPEGSIEKGASVAALEEPVLGKLLTAARGLNAVLIVSWSDIPTQPGSSYQWLRAWAKENDVAFADWYPMVESVQKAIPGIPITNNHSGGHYRTWVNSMVARAFAYQIQKRERIGE